MTRIMHTRTSRRILASIFLYLPLIGQGNAGVGRAAAAPQGEAAAKALAQKAVKQPPKRAAKEKETVAEPAAKPAEGNLRDPFNLPKPMIAVQGNQAFEEPTGPLPPGAKGLIIDQLKLEGIVRVGATNPKMIAVLANPANRAYFLHENDQLYNGAITKITPDSVHFREDFHDPTGKLQSREVIRQLAPAPGEKK